MCKCRQQPTVHSKAPTRQQIVHIDSDTMKVGDLEIITCMALRVQRLSGFGTTLHCRAIQGLMQRTYQASFPLLIQVHQQADGVDRDEATANGQAKPSCQTHLCICIWNRQHDLPNLHSISKMSK